MKHRSPKKRTKITKTNINSPKTKEKHQKNQYKKQLLNTKPFTEKEKKI